MDIDIKINGIKSKWNCTKPLLTKGSSNKKIAKSEKFQGGIYSTMILHLAPARVSGFNVCPHSSKGCRAICLNMAGQGGMFKGDDLHTSMIHVARVGRTTLLKTKKKLFFKKLINEIGSFLIKCEMKESQPCLRLNGTSDINWRKLTDPSSGKNLMTLFPEIQFYDYTKDIKQLEQLPENYYMTFSRAENNDLDVARALDMGVNIAVVFDKKLGIPDSYMGYPVFNADETDLRFLDGELSGFDKPFIVGLIEKGYLARRDTSGFVVRTLDDMKAVA